MPTVTEELKFAYCHLQSANPPLSAKLAVFDIIVSNIIYQPVCYPPLFSYSCTRY